MKKVINKTVLLTCLLTIISTAIVCAQSSTWNGNSTFKASFKNLEEGQLDIINISSVVVNHEEQYFKFKDFKNAIKNSNNLVLKTSNRTSTDALKVGFTYEIVWLKSAGKEIKLQDVTVKENSRKGKENHIKLKYKKAS